MVPGKSNVNIIWDKRLARHHFVYNFKTVLLSRLDLHKIFDAENFAFVSKLETTLHISLAEALCSQQNYITKLADQPISF